jgi:steroid delta-isomerase-like uncharacterized protein
MADPTSIAREYLECFNSRDWSKMRGLLHSDFTYAGPDGQSQSGPDAGIAVAQMFAAALPDGKIQIKNQYAEGNTAVTEFVGSGTQDGELLGIAPSGRKVVIPVCNIVEVRGDKITAEREYMDIMNVMQQIGAAPAPSTA